MLEFKNAVVVVLIFLKHNGLCGRLPDSNCFYTEELIPCKNFRVRITCTVVIVLAIYEDLQRFGAFLKLCCSLKLNFFVVLVYLDLTKT